MYGKLKKMRLNIRQHVLLLIFGCCLFTFLAMVTVSFHSFLDIRNAVREQGIFLSERVSDSLGNFSETSIKNVWRKMPNFAHSTSTANFP